MSQIAFLSESGGDSMVVVLVLVVAVGVGVVVGAAGAVAEGSLTHPRAQPSHTKTFKPVVYIFYSLNI